VVIYRHMKYLKSYKIFESSHKDEILNSIDSLLSNMVDFPEIYKNNIEAWTSIIDGVDWENYVESTDDGYENEHILSEEEYEKYVDEWEIISPDRKNFDYFMASVHGYGDYYHEGDIESQIQNKPIEWYEQEFRQPLYICKIMKALGDEDISDLSPGFFNI